MLGFVSVFLSSEVGSVLRRGRFAFHPAHSAQLHLEVAAARLAVAAVLRKDDEDVR